MVGSHTGQCLDDLTERRAEDAHLPVTTPDDIPGAGREDESIRFDSPRRYVPPALVRHAHDVLIEHGTVLGPRHLEYPAPSGNYVGRAVMLQARWRP